MPKEILLSFHYRYFKPLLYGFKKYEYRKRFCKEPVRAFLYLRGKPQKFVGILKSLPVHKPLFIHNHNEIYNNNRSVSVAEMEKTKEYQIYDERYKEQFKDYFS